MFQQVPTFSKSNEFSIPSDFEEAEILSLIISVRVKETPENLEKTQCKLFDLFHSFLFLANIFNAIVLTFIMHFFVNNQVISMKKTIQFS